MENLKTLEDALEYIAGEGCRRPDLADTLRALMKPALPPDAERLRALLFESDSVAWQDAEGLREARDLFGSIVSALSALPDDVARDAEVLREVLDVANRCCAPESLEAQRAEDSRVRLATAAARVPGLETERLADSATIIGLKERAERAESERDAARQDAREWRAVADERLAQVDRERKSTSVEIRALTARVAERERDDARESERHAADCFKEAEARATAAEASLSEEQAISEEAWDVLEEAGIERTCTLAEGIRKLQALQPTPAPGLREAAKCSGCPHPPHLGPCNRRAGDTAYACLCTRDTLPATPEPSVTHAQLAAVVEDIAATQEPAFDSNDEFSEGKVEGAREVLRRVTGGQVPPVVEWKDKAAKWDAAVEREARLTPEGRVSLKREKDLVAYVLHGDGLTLPTAPGGGETGPNTPETVDAARGALGFSTTGMSGWTARIAPTPTPEWPALAARWEQGQCLGEPCVRSALTVGQHLAECPTSSRVLVMTPQPAVWMSCSNAACTHPPCPPGSTHCTACGQSLPQYAWAPLSGKEVPTATSVPVGASFVKVVPRAQPKPAAPEVVLDCDGVLVSVFPGGLHPVVTYPHRMGAAGALNVVIRALAEAKRETRKAAEDMRERAWRSLQTEVDHGEWSDTVRDMLSNVVDALRRLPIDVG